MNNLSIDRHKALDVLAGDINGDGVAIEFGDIERIVDIYVRIVLTAGGLGCDNTKTIYQNIDPFAVIDFDALNDEGIESLKQFILSLDMMAENVEEKDKIHYKRIDEKTLKALLDGNNIIIALKHVQSFMHFLGAFAQQFIMQNKLNTLASFEFNSYGDHGGLTFRASLCANSTIAFTYFNSSLIFNLKV